MDKKDKILLLLAPVAVVAGGYLLFGDRFTTEENTVPESKENFTTIEAPITEIRKKRTEIYQDKYEEENGKARERNIQSDDSFFGDEVKQDAASISEETVSQESQENEDNFNQPVEKVESKKVESKPKVIVKYVERETTPVEKLASQVLEPTTEKPLRRRTGFVEGTTQTNSSTQSLNENSSEEINVAAVVQDDIEVKQGSNIILRTTEEATINGVVIPKNTLITGVVNLGQQRLNIEVSTIKTPSKTLSVKLKGYDLDGNEGMPLEGGIDKEIKRDVINDAITATRQVVRVPILNNTPTRAGQKKVNDPSVPVPKGYKITLKP